jgi:trigger factor
MNITLKNSDSVNATITVAIEKEDYQPQVQKALSDIRKNVVIDGFRKGNGPKSRIEAQYGKSVLVDEINQLVTQKLFDYIKEQNLNILGEPLPNRTERKPLDFDNQENYEFTFDVALFPEIDTQLTKDDKVPYYQIIVEDEMIEQQINYVKSCYGTHEEADSVEENDMVKGTIIELNEDATEKEDGIKNETAMLIPRLMKDEAEKAKFAGAKLEDAIIFNPYKAYDGNEAELSSFLVIEKEDIVNHQGDFSFLVKEITRYKEAELNQELFDEIYTPGVITSEAEFREKIKEQIIKGSIPDSDYKFYLDVRQLLLDKAKDVQFPDAFLKRWLLESNAINAKETLEEDYPVLLNVFKIQLIKDKIINENKIQIEKDEIRQRLTGMTRAQFEKHGINIPESVVENHVNDMLKNEKNVRNVADRIIEDKLIEILKTQVTLEPKEITVEALRSFFEEQK